MSVMGEEDGQGFDSGNVSQGEDGTGNINPAWNDLLGELPEELHSKVTPHLSKWDQNYQNGIQKVHSQYEPYKPIIDNGFQPDQINYAMSVLQAIETQPQEVMKALQAYVGGEEDDTDGQGQQTQENGPESFDLSSHPEFSRTREMVETMAQLLVQQREQEAQTQADNEVEQEFSRLREEKGEFDEEWVLTKLYNNPEWEIEQGVQAYHDFVQQIRSNSRKPGPRVLGPGGSIPNQDLDPRKLDPKGTRNLMAQMLQQAAEQNQ